MIELRTLMMPRSAADWGIADNFPTLTTRNPTIRHRGHCAPFQSYSAHFGTR
jgi:hypothetical protein